MKTNSLVGGLLVIYGIYILAMQYWFPEKFSSKMTPSRRTLLAVIAILGGLLTVFGDVVGRLFLKSP